MAKYFEPETLIELPRCFIVIEVHAEKCRYAQSRALFDNPLFEISTESHALEIGRNVEADLGRCIVSRSTTVKRRQANPSDNFAIAFGNPDRSLDPIKLLEPIESFANRDWLGIRRRPTAWNGLVVDIDDDW